MCPCCAKGFIFVYVCCILWAQVSLINYFPAISVSLTSHSLDQEAIRAAQAKAMVSITPFPINQCRGIHNCMGNRQVQNPG